MSQSINVRMGRVPFSARASQVKDRFKQLMARLDQSGALTVNEIKVKISACALTTWSSADLWNLTVLQSRKRAIQVLEPGAEARGGLTAMSGR